MNSQPPLPPLAESRGRTSGGWDLTLAVCLSACPVATGFPLLDLVSLTMQLLWGGVSERMDSGSPLHSPWCPHYWALPLQFLPRPSDLSGALGTSKASHCPPVTQAPPVQASGCHRAASHFCILISLSKVGPLCGRRNENSTRASKSLSS